MPRGQRGRGRENNQRWAARPHPIPTKTQWQQKTTHTLANAAQDQISDLRDPVWLISSHRTTVTWVPLSKCLATTDARRPRRCPRPSTTTSFLEALSCLWAWPVVMYDICKGTQTQTTSEPAIGAGKHIGSQNFTDTHEIISQTTAFNVR